MLAAPCLTSRVGRERSLAAAGNASDRSRTPAKSLTFGTTLSNWPFFFLFFLVLVGEWGWGDDGGG